MTEDRLMVAKAVFEGVIGEEHLTQDEIDEMFQMVCDVATEQELIKARERGCNVFVGFEDHVVH